MTGILVFRSRHGEIAVEVDEDLAQAVGGKGPDDGLITKGVRPLTRKGGEVMAGAPVDFSQAMSTLRAYAGALEDLVMGLDLMPSEVSVQIGLKLTGSAGFIIAKAGTEAEMQVALKWQPRAGKAGEGT